MTKWLYYFEFSTQINKDISMKCNYGLLLAIILPLSLKSMEGFERDTYDHLKDTKKKLCQMGNIFDPEPTDENAPLEVERLKTDFYEKLKGKSSAEIQKTAEEILSLNFNGKGNGRALYRYHVAAAVLAGAHPDIVRNKRVSHITLLQDAAMKDDYALCHFLLQRKADPNKDGDFGPVLFLCRTVKLAQLMLDHGADPRLVNKQETLLHRVARSSSIFPYETELIPLYRSHGISVFSVDDHNGTPIYTLAASATRMEKDDIKKKLDVLMQGLSPSEKKALLAISQKNWGTVFQLLEAQSQYDKKIGGNDSDWVKENEQKSNYLKTLLQSHLESK